MRKYAFIWSIVVFTFTAIRAAASPLLGAAAPSTEFNTAVRLDLAGKTKEAFASYLSAANKGLSQAQFNVAVMFDSGRGTPRDMGKAALWYARAAAHGNQRAQYNLGQLYETGEGVPQNLLMARAWFAASGLAASSAHLSDRHRTQDLADITTLIAPDVVAPTSGAIVKPEMGGVVMVWDAKPEPVSVKYYIEIRSITSSTSQEVFSSSTNLSSIFAILPKGDGIYAWRIILLSDERGIYLPGEWLRFSVSNSES